MRIIILAFCFFTFKPTMGQTIDILKIDNGKQVYVNESIVLIVGYNFKSDGYGQFSIIQAFDTSLKQKWTYTLDERHTNTIDKVCIYNKKIIFTGLIGERSNSSLNTTRYIKVLDLDGKKILDMNIGASTYPCTNLLINNEKLFFSYQKCETTLFSDMMHKSKNVFVEFDLTVKKIKFTEHKLIRSKPIFVASNDMRSNKYFLFGEQYKTEEFNVTESFVKIFPNREGEVIIPADKMESIGKIIRSQNAFDIISYSNPFVESQERYLRFDKIDFDSKLLFTKIIPFSQLGWYHIYLEFTSVENELWFYAFKSDKEAVFTRLNNKGEKIEEIQSNILDGSNDFYVTRDYIFHLFKEDEKLKLTKIKR